MEFQLTRLTQLLEQGKSYLSDHTVELSHKISPEKWSKKEILGHLIDSAIVNHQRFVTAQFSEQPYQVITYQQNDMVIFNDYQESQTEELVSCWLSVNHRIMHVVRKMPRTSLEIPILLNDGSEKKLAFLITDYVDHLEHHLKQIMA